jgi:lipopolysaccharide/colanic/teichoic acid biosynthesis glycosyltransferase
MNLQKRIFDLTLAIPGLIVISPIWFIVALLIKVEDGGPVLFKQTRVGLNGVPFQIWKFRSMSMNSDKIGPQITIGNDSRITTIGAVIRRYKLDELPQLMNVLFGEMSFVGPRPEVLKYVSLYTAQQRKVLELTPGLTDLASIKYRRESELLALSSDPEKTYIEEIMPEKIRINLEYLTKSSVFSDILVIFNTLRLVFL